MTGTEARRAPTRGRLSRGVIVDAAAAILAADGLAGLTMRRVAKELGVEAMSLYNHVSGKRDLLEGVVALKLATLGTPDPAASWSSRLRALVLSFYQVLARDPWLVMVLTTEQIEPREPAVVGAMETAVRALADAGLSPGQQVSAFRGLLALCFGLVLTHTIGLSRSPAEAEAVFAEADMGQWAGLGVPHLAALAPQFLRTRPTDDLEFMLERYLAALGGSGIDAGA